MTREIDSRRADTIEAELELLMKTTETALDGVEPERKERIDKSALILSEPRRIRDLGHLAFYASKPCLVCGRDRTHIT